MKFKNTNLNKILFSSIFIFAFVAKAELKIRLHEFNKSDVTTSIPVGAWVEIQNTSDQEHEQVKNLFIQCNQDIQFRENDHVQNLFQAAKKIYSEKNNAQKVFLRISNENTKCILKIDNQVLYLESESLNYPWMNQFRALNKKNESLQQRIEILDEPFKALNARFKALFGYEMTYEEYLKKDPNMKIDFTRAPKLDLIVFNTLQIMNDFVGRIMMRGLALQASRGTLIYFMTSENMIKPKDQNLIRQFLFQYPHVRHELFKYTAQDLSFGELINTVHRTNHVKVLVTYSSTDKSLNHFMTGGRNMTEQYFFLEKPDNSAYPDIVQWGKEKDNGWVYFDDTDVDIIEHPQLSRWISQLIQFNEHVNQPQDLNLIRSQDSLYLAVPTAKKTNSTENQLIDLFQSAEQEILIYSPYVNLTSNLKQALLNAKSRGVRVRFVTNISVEGDFMPSLLQPIVYHGLRNEANDFEIKIYRLKDRIMHTKAIFIDRKKVVLGSVNLNQRSLYQDTEIMVQLTDINFIISLLNEFKKEIDVYSSPLDKNEIPKMNRTEKILKSFLHLF